MQKLADNGNYLLKNGKIMNKNVIAIGLSLLLLFFLFALKPSHDMNIINPVSTTLPTTNLASQVVPTITPSTINQNVSNPEPTLNLTKWQSDLLMIDENPLLNSDKKIDKLLALLSQYKDDDLALEAILQTLANYTPSKAISDILPYLQAKNPRIQATALASLHNAMFLTEDEEKQQQSFAHLDKLRETIAPAVNALYDNPETSDAVKQAILSSYALTNANPTDTQKMLNNLANQGVLESNSSAYLADILLNGELNNPQVLATIEQFAKPEQEKIIQRLGTNIMANPEVLQTLSDKQKQTLKTFIENNPPHDKSPENLHSLELYQNILSLF